MTMSLVPLTNTIRDRAPEKNPETGQENPGTNPGTGREKPGTSPRTDAPSPENTDGTTAEGTRGTTDMSPETGAPNGDDPATKEHLQGTATKADLGTGTTGETNTGLPLGTDTQGHLPWQKQTKKQT